MATWLPGQKGLADAAMDTPAGRLLLTTMLIVFEMAGLPLMQEADEVMLHDT